MIIAIIKLNNSEKGKCDLYDLRIFTTQKKEIKGK